MVEYAYDIMDRVTNISWRTTSGATIGGFEYEYDAVGRIVSRSHMLGDPSQPSQPSQMSQSSRQVIADIDENDNVLVSYTWADGIDNLLAVKIGSNSYLIRFALFNE